MKSTIMNGPHLSRRRFLAASAASMATMATMATATSANAVRTTRSSEKASSQEKAMESITLKDGTQIYYKD